MNRILRMGLVLAVPLILAFGATGLRAAYDAETPSQKALSSDEVLVAGTNSENNEVNFLIESLESFLLANTRNSGRVWWLSTTGSISVIDVDDNVRATIPNLAVVFNLGKGETSLKLGDLELKISSESNERLNISIQFPSRIRLRNPDGSVSDEIRIDRSQFSLIWDSGMKTIIENQFVFRDISLRSNDNLIGQIERIESIGKLEERQKGFWSGSLIFRIQNLVSNFIKIAEIETQYSVNNLRLQEFTTAMKKVDFDGRFGSWYFGGALYPTGLYEHTITRENVISFIDATRKALPAMGDVFFRSSIRNFSIPGIFSIAEIRAHSDNLRDSSGLANLSAQFTFDGINVSTKPDIVAFQDLIPRSIKFDLNLHRLPEISLIDILRTITFDALKEDWTVMSKRKKDDVFLKLLFTHISEISMILANEKTKVSINDVVFKAPLYVARLKGDVIAEPSAIGKFLGNLELNISGDKNVINMITDNALAQKFNGNQKMSESTTNATNYTYSLAVGNDGRIRLNGTDLGPLLPEHTKFELMPPLTKRKTAMPIIPREIKNWEVKDIEKRLRLLKTLFDKGLIQKDEYDEKRREIIKSL